MKHFYFLFILLSVSLVSYSQQGFPINGVQDERNLYYAFTGATVHISADQVITNGTLLVYKDKIIEAGATVKIPEGAVIINIPGKHIYPALIDCWSGYGVAQASKKRENRANQMERTDPGPYSWNMAISPETEAAAIFEVKPDEAASLRKQGFGTVFSHRQDGISRGAGVVVNLADARENEVILSVRSGSFFSFQKGSSLQEYPSSLMGAIALLRQTYIDATWYAQGKTGNYVNRSLEKFIEQKKQFAFFEVRNWQDLLRADKLGDEFGVQYVIKTNGDEYQRLDAVKQSKATLIVPLNFPEAWDLSDAYTAPYIPLSTLRHWEQAPANAALIYRAEIPFTITAAGLKDPGKFWEQLGKAVEMGLPAKEALRAITETPARILSISELTGDLKTGKFANFFITTDTLFNKSNRIIETWVQGKRYQNEVSDQPDIRGKYTLTMSSEKAANLDISGSVTSPEAKLILPQKTLKINFSQSGNRVNMQFPGDDLGLPGSIVLNGFTDTIFSNNVLSGQGKYPSGESISWKATWQGPRVDSTKTDSTVLKFTADSVKMWYPDAAFGFTKLPEQETVLIKNATVWTNEAEGKLENASVLFSKGKILAVGKEIDPVKFLIKGISPVIIDGTGKHVTAGIVDEHSHIAITGGVNEGTQNNTAEVRIGDALDGFDNSIYHQLSGGVTTSQLLHGSANPIGGQSAIIKLKWGSTPEELKMKNAPQHIKFALGENVKQSNWGDGHRIRFPQTRMGVEQVYYDAFQRAIEYRNSLKAWSLLPEKEKAGKEAPRRDLELEALVEIMEGRRFITCHSYVQSEINMLIHVADSMGFKINTFTHILEGYKVADKMKAHGINGSTFSDWWAYKWEVNEAIPYNGAIMHTVGVNTGFNSDDAEMGRRLNQEAAKAVLYGGVSEIDAIKFVTLNPAKMLHIDSVTGSLKAGKIADIVIWSDNPLSVYARAEQTFVEGAKYFDLQRNVELQKAAEAERARITQKMLNEKAGGKALRKPVIRKINHYHCEDFEDYQLLLDNE